MSLEVEQEQAKLRSKGNWEIHYGKDMRSHAGHAEETQEPP